MLSELAQYGDEVLLDDDDDGGGWLATHGIDRGMEWCCQQKFAGMVKKESTMHDVNEFLQICSCDNWWHSLYDCVLHNKSGILLE
jgi:hypothetical protein